MNVFYNSVAGNITNLTYTSTADGAVAAVLGRNGKGVVKLSVSPSLPFNSVLEAGGGDLSYGWWILALSGGNSGTGRFTNSSFRLLTQQNYYTTTYPYMGFTAELSGSAITGLTSDPTITVIPLSFYSAMNNFPIYMDNFSSTSSGSGYLGGEGYVANKGLYSVGNLGGIEFTSGEQYVWYNETSSPFMGYIAGWISQRTDTQYNMNGYLAGILPDNTGIFIGELTTGGQPNVLQYTNGYWLEGQVTGVANIGSCAPTPYLISGLSIYNSSFVASLSNSTGRSFVDTAKFGVGFIGMGGSYDPAYISDDWYLSYTGTFGSGAFGAIALGSKWGTENNVEQIIRGRTYGYYYDLAPTTPVTGIFVGETAGTFVPGDNYWQTVTVGSFVETNTFLNNTGTLGNIGIPVVQVGNLTLSGNDPGCTTDCIASVTMNNVRFFAPQSGQPPTIWATNSVTGSVNGNPISDNITLTGGGLSANFFMNAWNANKWSAIIEGSGSAFGYTIDDMRGVSAGTYSGSNFTGTAPGAVRAH